MLRHEGFHVFGENSTGGNTTVTSVAVILLLTAVFEAVLDKPLGFSEGVGRRCRDVQRLVTHEGVEVALLWLQSIVLVVGTVIYGIATVLVLGQLPNEECRDHRLDQALGSVRLR